MPELPEVETTVRGIATVLEGRVLTRVEPRRPDLRRPMPVDLRQRLTGARVTGLSRSAKYGLIDTDRGDTLIFHLGMSGRWRIDPDEIGKHDHVILETDEGRTLALNDHRRFGSLDLVETSALWEWPPLRVLGPEPLSDAFTWKTLARTFESRVAPIKALLLDQRVVAGLGNIYVCEALFMAGIKPNKPAGQVSTARLKLLVTAIKAVLASAIEAGGSTLRDYAKPDGELGYFSKRFQVYGREDEACPKCAHPIARRIDAGRSSFHCTKCQR